MLNKQLPDWLTYNLKMLSYGKYHWIGFRNDNSTGPKWVRPVALMSETSMNFENDCFCVAASCNLVEITDVSEMLAAFIFRTHRPDDGGSTHL
jgi:hypothetical protein